MIDTPTKPKPTIEARCQPGDLWQLGEHRLLCGDAMNEENSVRLMAGELADAVVTDLPYCIAGGGSSSMGRRAQRAIDRQFFRIWFRCHLQNITPYTRPHAAYWSTIDWRGATAIEEALPATSWRFAGLGVWVRGGLGMGFALRTTHEHFVLLARAQWQRVLTNEVDVWAYQWTPANRKHGHAAEKPIELIERAITLCGGNLILDPFAGSGTTILAAHHQGRRCLATEIDPAFCDIALHRYEQATGDSVHLLERIPSTESIHDSPAYFRPS